MSEVALNNPEREEARRVWRQKITDMIAGNAVATAIVEKPMKDIGHDEEVDS